MSEPMSEPTSEPMHERQPRGVGSRTRGSEPWWLWLAALSRGPAMAGGAGGAGAAAGAGRRP